MTDAVASALETLNALRERRRSAAASVEKARHAAKAIAFDAHGARNMLAQKRLAELNRQVATEEQEVRSIDDAIEEAERRVKYAEAGVANAAEREKAHKVLRDAEEAARLSVQADAAGRKFRESLLALEQAMERVARSGYRGVAPSRGMQLALTRSVQGLLIGLKHVGIDVPALPPSQRKGLAETVSGSIQSAREAAQRIIDGEPETNAAA